MARVSKLRHEGDRVTDLINIGVLTKQFPLPRIRSVLEETGRSSQRQRDLPAHVMVYYVIAMALYRPEGMREVLRLLLEGLRAALGVGVGLEPAGKSGISQARSRLGEEPLRRLYEQSVQPVAQPQSRGSFYRAWHVVALDGTTLEVPDTQANETAFGRPASPSGGQSAYPLIRLVGLVEVGTHVLFGAVLGSYGTGEVTLARKVVPHLRAGMLCLADRYFPGYPLWKQATDTGAELVWRVRQAIHFEVEERLPDGSFLSRFHPGRQKGQPRGGAIPVRVIDYQVQGPERKEETIRIITSILDWEAAPAAELAAVYHERWEFETALDEFKTHLRGARTVLRSQTPELVRQEVYGLLLAHFALRGLMHEAALSAGRDPDRISFVHTLRVVRRTLPRFAALPPSAVEGAARGPAGRDPRGRRRPSTTAPDEAGSEEKAEQVPGQTALRPEQDRPVRLRCDY
jgi:hypothetical protein